MRISLSLAYQPLNSADLMA